MPAAARKTCRKPGCPALHSNRSGLCDKHDAESQAAYEASRGSAASRGYGDGWRKIRKIKLTANPMCEKCKVKVAVLVHHKDQNSANNSQENLLSLCQPCHEDIHGRERFKPRQRVE